MNILNRVRKLIKDTSDSKISKEDKLTYLQDSIDFYDQNIIKETQSILSPESDNITFLLPENYSSFVGLYVNSDYDLFMDKRDQDYQLFELEDYTIDEVSGEITILNDIYYTELRLDYNKASTWTITKIVGAVTAGSNVIVTLDEIEGFKKNDSIIIETTNGEEEVKVKTIDKNNKQITVDLANNVDDGSQVIGQVQVKSSDFDIITYYTGNLSYNVNTGVTTSGSSTKWTQGKITYEQKKGTNESTNGYMEIVTQLLDNHPDSKDNQESLGFGFITLT